ncbi:SDR family oxidoreductase [Acidipila sp. EB88]|uniref:SDR family oxidoreductase n=1 Tax=Acidipila sp. EB88 TaxID=2305226 RepID=UPI000F5E8FEE|nr:SDR family oxidoreductase [Acidipila sp. EB88]RRA48926.1 SDR family oxidoreductase [Acidipila sp. EB88]
MARNPLTFGPKPPFPTQQQQPAPGSEAAMEPAPDHGLESYTGRDRLTGRAALITGADSGIGRAVAILFAKEGADIVFTHLPEEADDARVTIAAVEKQGRKAHAIALDLSQQQSAAIAVEETVKLLGKLDIVVNNAAFQRTHQELSEIPYDEFAETFRVNVFATFAVAQAAEKHLKAGGVILNTTSIQAFNPSPNLIAYAATKAAIANLTKSLAKALASKGIRVNGVAPGPVWTPLIPATMEADKVKEFGKTTVFQRPAQPVELGSLYVFLASDDASFVTGEIYGATGGLTPL